MRLYRSPAAGRLRAVWQRGHGRRGLYSAVSMVGSWGAETVGTNLAALAGPCWSEVKVCAELGVTSSVLAVWRECGVILGPLTRDGSPVYPVAQFRRIGSYVEVRSALLPFLHALREHDPWTVAVLLDTPAPELYGVTPLAWLEKGGSPEALDDLADLIAQQWARSDGL